MPILAVKIDVRTEYLFLGRLRPSTIPNKSGHSSSLQLSASKNVPLQSKLPRHKDDWSAAESEQKARALSSYVRSEDGEPS